MVLFGSAGIMLWGDFMAILRFFLESCGSCVVYNNDDKNLYLYSTFKNSLLRASIDSKLEY